MEPMANGRERPVKSDPAISEVRGLVREPQAGHWARAEWERLRALAKAQLAELDELDTQPSRR